MDFAFTLCIVNSVKIFFLFGIICLKQCVPDVLKPVVFPWFYIGVGW